MSKDKLTMIRLKPETRDNLKSMKFDLRSETMSEAIDKLIEFYKQNQKKR